MALVVFGKHFRNNWTSSVGSPLASILGSLLGAFREPLGELLGHLEDTLGSLGEHWGTFWTPGGAHFRLN